MNLENYLSNVKSTIKKHWLPVVVLAGISGLLAYDKISEHNIHKDLNNGAFWAGGNQFDEQYQKAFLKNKDINSDGKYETVIRYVGSDGNYHELEMKFNQDGIPQVIFPK
jgi:hypothetical protein